MESLSPWKKSNFGMNNSVKSSSIFKPSYHLYSSAYELEYSYNHDIGTSIYFVCYDLNIFDFKFNHSYDLYE
jgi:hypothetical protein